MEINASDLEAENKPLFLWQGEKPTQWQAYRELW